MNCTEIDWKLIFDILKSISIITASCVAIYGINSWRREARWKRKYELAEEVLSSMYEAHQAIKIIRSPIGFGNEGSSREKSKNETKEQTEIYNQAYVTRERFQRNKKSLEKLRRLKYRFITLYGKDYEKYFDKFSQTINRIFSASDLIARVKLGQFDHDKEFKLQIMKENSKILYNVFKGEDEIEEELKTAITAIEEKCRAIIGKNN
ncbi:hypothetical protein SAMN05444483_10623 [Salegentibacter echinorum]|uniref:Uncharacterized protein n=1 Tax=Salegentibacter echinorum TaxID=1073325 RepID=A0A1M5HVY0_SALEC|nr:hypothetical protein [Salegentibacter echinorum]SHG20121.1 hypothetical protein SAMN05444483_10623 [Salegentibacter echinorum]